MISPARLLALVCVLAAFLEPRLAFPFVVIDDFDVGPYYQVATESLDAVVPVGPVGSGHVISPNRHFSFDTDPNHPGFLIAWVGAGGGARYQILSESGYGDLDLEWNWGYAADLTEGGAVDSIALDVTGTNIGGINVVLTFQDVNGSHGIGRSISNNGRVAYPLADWTAIDMTQVTGLSLKVQLRIPGGALFELNDVRTVGEGAITPNFVGDWILVETNPLPSAPCIFRTLDPIGNSLYQTEIGWQDIQVGGDVPALHGVWGDVPLGGGETCGITMNTDPDGGYIYGWYGTFELYVNIADVTGVAAEVGYPPDPIEPDAGAMSLALPFVVMTDDGGGDFTGSSNVLMTLTLGENQPAEFQNVVILPTLGKQQTISGFRVAFDLVTQDVILDSEPVFVLGWSSEWKPAVATDVASPESENALPPTRARLTARPSVTRGSTEIRAARPFAGGERVTIFDVRGRVVRVLAPPSGGSAVVWDGFDARGSRLAPGVYFARTASERGGPAARVVLVR